jgi:hypothetical protein
MRARCSAMAKTPKSKNEKPRHIRMSAETGAVELQGANVIGAERSIVPNVAKSALKSDKLNDEERERLKSARKDFEALYDTIAAGGEFCRTQDALRALSLEFEILAMAVKLPQVAKKLEQEINDAQAANARKGATKKKLQRQAIIKEHYRGALSKSKARALAIIDVCKPHFEAAEIEDFSVSTIKRDIKDIKSERVILPK